jgi:hypothetical protein
MTVRRSLAIGLPLFATVVLGLIAPKVRHQPSGPPPPKQIIGEGSANATVLDPETKLEWQRVLSPGFYSWDETGTSPASGQYYCQHLNLAGHASGWRLPTLKELQSIVDGSARPPKIDHSAFPDTPANGYFWTATGAGPHAAWYVYFSNGKPYVNDIGYGYRVRCVR